MHAFQLIYILIEKTLKIKGIDMIKENTEAASDTSYFVAFC